MITEPVPLAYPHKCMVCTGAPPNRAGASPCRPGPLTPSMWKTTEPPGLSCRVTIATPPVAERPSIGVATACRHNLEIPVSGRIFQPYANLHSPPSRSDLPKVGMVRCAVPLRPLPPLPVATYFPSPFLCVSASLRLCVKPRFRFSAFPPRLTAQNPFRLACTDPPRTRLLLAKVAGNGNP